MNKGSSSFAPKPTTSISPIPQKAKLHSKGFGLLASQGFKCQGFGHLASDCTNRRFVTLAKWKAAEEVELEEENEEHDGDNLGEIVAEADKGEMLTMDTHHPPRSNEHLSLVITFDEPLNLSPTPPITKTLKQNFCLSIPESLLEAPNSELRACEEVVQSWYKESPMYNTQISKGSERTRVSKFNRELCEWLILFQPKLKQGEEVIT